MKSFLLGPSFAFALIAGSGVARAQDSGLDDRLADLEDRLDQVEKKLVLDRVKIDGDYRTTLNAYTYEGPGPDSYDRDPASPLSTRRVEEATDEVWSHRLRLRFLAEPTSSVRVTARLTMYKHFSDGDAPPFIQDSASTRVPRDSSARFDQAWLDWFLTDWLALSAGRIAYTEGNPQELRENSTVRRGTWGLHMVDGEYDTINMTLNLEEVLHGAYLRFFYASWFFDNDQDVFGGLPYLSSGTDPLRILGGNVDLVVPGLGKNLLQLGYYVVPRFRPFFMPIQDPIYQPQNDYTHAPAPLNTSLLFPSEMPDSLGSYSNLSALFLAYDVGGSGLDLFASGALGFLKPNGRGIEYELPLNPLDVNSPRASLPMLFLASQGDDGKTQFFYAGGRYTLPITSLNEPKLGFEYNHGSRYLISFAVQNDQMLSKLSVRGDAFETYLILPFGEAVFLRVGHLYVHSKYDGGMFGPSPAMFGSTAPETDRKTHNFNATLNVDL